MKFNRERQDDRKGGKLILAANASAPREERAFQFKLAFTIEFAQRSTIGAGSARFGYGNLLKLIVYLYSQVTRKCGICASL